MPILTIDTETQGLNTQKFIMGVITHQNGKSETFNNKETMWNRIMHLAERSRVKKECLIVYAHNMGYDFRVIRPEVLPKGMYQFCNNPFIIDMEDDKNLSYGKPRIFLKFLSTTSLWYGSLATIGEALGNPKGETPEWLCQDEDYEPTFLELNEARTYMIQDSELLMDFVLQLKKKLAKIGVKPRHLITIPQIGINYMIQQLKKRHPNPDAFFENINRRRVHKTNYPDIINASARAGRVEAFKLGKVNEATHIDVNSLWPHCMQHMKMPDLRTETYIEEPVKNNYTEQEILNHIGVSTCTIETIPLDYGILPLRPSADENFYPNGKHLIIGTWTHQEIRYALKRGYTLIHLHKSLIYQETTNPFKDIIQEIYDKKQQADNPLDRHIYKMLLNGSIGKFKQRRYHQDYKWVYPSEEQELIDKGWECIEIWKNQRLYAKQGAWQYPNYSAPILYSLITADARLRMLHDFEKIPRKDLYYCDTDCIVATPKAIENAKFKYSENIGDYKIEHDQEEFLCYGKKNYMIGETIKASGVGKDWQTSDDFRKGYLTYKKMHTEHTTPDKELVGTFATITRDLWETMVRTETTKKEEQRHLIHIDNKHRLVDFDDVITQWMQSKESTPSPQAYSESYS